MDKQEKVTKSTTINVKINYTCLLTMIFVVLKLTGVISWSWYWVISPILIELLICLIAIIILDLS